MDDAKYRRWWQLHLRVARGETLNPAEQAEYARGLKCLIKRRGSSSNPIA